MATTKCPVINMLILLNCFFFFQEKVQGVIIVQSKTDLAHNGIGLVMDGTVNLQLSAKSVGVFEAFYNSIKPITLVNQAVEIQKTGKLYHSLISILCVLVCVLLK